MGIGNVSERRLAQPQIGVSVVILALGPHGDSEASGHSRLWLPLVRRVKQPFMGAWALPGGDLRVGHSLEESAFKALESTTELHPKYLEQLYTFGDPARSSGGLPMVSIVYWALVGEAETKDFAEVDNVKWFPADELPDLAFDHRRIIEYALWRSRSKLEYPDIATKLVGEEFTLSQLHDVYEAVTGQPLDLANFRRKMLASGHLEDTGRKRHVGRSRPATVYRYRHDGTAKEDFPLPAAVNPPRSAGRSDDALSALMPS